MKEERKYYSVLEFLGFKSHIPGDEEMCYFNALNKYEQFDNIIKNEKFAMDLYDSHRKKIAVLSIMFVLFAVVSFSLYYLIPVAILGIYFKILTKKIKSANLQRNIFSAMKRDLVDAHFNNIPIS